MNTLCADGAFFARCRYFCKPKQNTFFKVSVRVCYLPCLLLYASSGILIYFRHREIWLNFMNKSKSITGNNWMYRNIKYPLSLKPRSVAEHTSEMPPNSLLLLYDRLCIENEKYPHQNTPILAIYIWYVRMIISTMHNL